MKRSNSSKCQDNLTTEPKHIHSTNVPIKDEISDDDVKPTTSTLQLSTCLKRIKKEECDKDDLIIKSDKEYDSDCECNLCGLRKKAYMHRIKASVNQASHGDQPSVSDSNSTKGKDHIQETIDGDSQQAISQKAQDRQDDDDEDRCPTPDYIKPFFSDNDDEESNDSDEDNVAYEQNENSNTTNNDESVQKEPETSESDHCLRRSTRGLGKEKKVYVYQADSSSSSDSDHHESSESEDDSDDYEPSDSSEEVEKEEQEQDSENENDYCHENWDSIEDPASASKLKKTTTQMSNEWDYNDGETSDLARVSTRDDDDSGDETELDETTNEVSDRDTNKKGPSSSFVCPQCEKSFKNNYSMVKHVRSIHQRIRPYKCKWSECRYSASSSSAVEIHIKRVHFVVGDKRNAKDFVEKEALSTTPYTNSRKRKNANSEPKVSKKRVRKTANTKPDKKKKTNVIVVRLNCPIDGCTQHRPNLVQLNAHVLESHHIEQYRCLVRDCGQSFKKSEQHILHKKQHDNTGSSLACPKCDYTTNKYSKLFYHFYLYHEYGHFACNFPKCDFVSNTCRQSINCHWYNHKALKYKCTVDECSEMFKENKLLKNHIKSHQTEVNRFSGCPHCGRRDFVRSNAFREHVQSHFCKTGGFQCAWKVGTANEGCGYFSTKVGYVHEHIRAQHLKDTREYQDLNKYVNKVFPNKTRVKKLRKSRIAALRDTVE